MGVPPPMGWADCKPAEDTEEDAKWEFAVVLLLIVLALVAVAAKINGVWP